ncbi:MAG: hypothetical protein WBO17_08945, partial [Sphingorhabdus sp.]
DSSLPNQPEMHKNNSLYALFTSFQTRRRFGMVMPSQKPVATWAKACVSMQNLCHLTLVHFAPALRNVTCPHQGMLGQRESLHVHSSGGTKATGAIPLHFNWWACREIIWNYQINTLLARSLWLTF